MYILQINNTQTLEKPSCSSRSDQDLFWVGIKPIRLAGQSNSKLIYLLYIFTIVCTGFPNATMLLYLLSKL